MVSKSCPIATFFLPETALWLGDTISFRCKVRWFQTRVDLDVLDRVAQEAARLMPRPRHELIGLEELRIAEAARSIRRPTERHVVRGLSIPVEKIRSRLILHHNSGGWKLIDSYSCDIGQLGSFLTIYNHELF